MMMAAMVWGLWPKLEQQGADWRDKIEYSCFNTSQIAENNNAIFAINGDYYGFRDNGLIIRNGTLYRDIVNSPHNEALAICYVWYCSNYSTAYFNQQGQNRQIKSACSFFISTKGCHPYHRFTFTYKRCELVTWMAPFI